MSARASSLSRHPDVSRGLTGPRVAEFDPLAAELLARFAAEEHDRLDRPTRQRAVGGGRAFGLPARDHLLAACVWPRLSPTYPVLASLFGGDDAPVRRSVPRWLGRLPAGVGVAGDLAHVGVNKLTMRPTATPRREPRGQDRPPADSGSTRAVARRRVRVEHTIGEVRRYRAVTRVDRQQRAN